MRKERNVHRKFIRYLNYMLIIAFGIIIIAGCGGGGGDGDSVPSPSAGSDTLPQTITSGTWTGSADFGEINFIVDSTSTGIKEITVTFHNFACGLVSLNSKNTFTKNPSWLIDDRQFTIEQIRITSGLPPLSTESELKIIGTFDNTGTNVSGTYEFIEAINGPSMTCSGIWNASFSSSASCGEGFPLTISDLSFPGTVTQSETYEGSVTFQGAFEDIANPRMFARIPYSGGIMTSKGKSEPAISDNCSLDFMEQISQYLVGTGDIYFKLVDYDDSVDLSTNWDNNSVSNQISQKITIQQ